MPLEKAGSSVSVDALMSATRATIMADEQNKITKTKAKIQPRMDFSTFRVDDKVPDLDLRLKTVPTNIVKEKTVVESPIVLETRQVKDASKTIVISDEFESVSSV